MGKELAKLLSQRGASIILVARNVDKLKSATDYARAAAKSPTQRFHFISADCTSEADNARLFAEALAWNNGTAPDIVWANAGTSTPGLFLDQKMATMKSQMDINYWAAVFLAQQTLKAWFYPETPYKKDAAQQHADLKDETADGRHDPQDDLHAGPHEQDVRDRAHAGSLAQGDPQQQHEETDDVGHPADADPGVDRQTLREHGPRVDAETCLDGQRATGAVEEETDEELENATSHDAIQSHNWLVPCSPIALFWLHGLSDLRSRALRRARRLAHSRTGVRSSGGRHPPAVSG